MSAVYKVRSSKAAKVLIGQMKQAIVEDAVRRAEAEAKGRDMLIVLRANVLPLCILIQPRNLEIDIVTNEEAVESGVMKLKDARVIDEN